MSKTQDKLTRIAIVSNDKCKPKKCRQECKKSCPVVRMGKLVFILKSIVPKKNICVYCHMSKKSRVGRSALIFFKLSAKPEIVVPGSVIRYFIFEISGKPSFVETFMMSYTVFLPSLLSISIKS